MNSRCIILFLVSLAVLPVKAQVRVTGIIINSTNKDPVPDVSVRIKGTLWGSYTNPEGKFRITSKKDSFVLVLSTIGYEPKEVSVKAGDTIYDAGIIEFEDVHVRFEKDKWDTIYLGDHLEDSAVIAKINGLTIHVAYRDFLTFFDSTNFPIRVSNRIPEIVSCLNYVTNEMKTKSQVKLEPIIKKNGPWLIAEFVAAMLDKGSVVAVYNGKNKRQLRIIRHTTGSSGRDGSRDCCWYGRLYYIPGHKKYFLRMTDIIF